jgi:hypothetical protein
MCISYIYLQFVQIIIPLVRSYSLLYLILTSALAGGEWSASRPGRFTPGESPRYPLNRRLGEPQNRSGRFGEEKILDPSGIRIPTPRSSSRYTDYAIPAL